MIMGLVKRENLIGFKIIDTLSAAIKWVDLPISDLDLIENAIQDLKKEI